RDRADHRRSEELYKAVHGDPDAEHRAGYGSDRRVLSGEREVVRADDQIAGQVEIRVKAVPFACGLPDRGAVGARRLTHQESERSDSSPRVRSARSVPYRISNGGAC